jgi:hypothetical protein
MWYREITAGVVDSLKDDFKPTGNVQRDLHNISFSSAYSMPKKDSIIRFFKSVLIRIPELHYGEVDSFIFALQYVSNNFSKIPEEIDFVRELQVLLSTVSNTINGRNPKIPLSVEKLQEFKKIPLIYATKWDQLNLSKVNDNLANHEYLFNVGYNAIINYWNDGLRINPPMMMTIVTNMDSKSSFNLRTQGGRDELKRLIIEAYPHLENFDTEKYSQDQIIQYMCDVLKKWKPGWYRNNWTEETLKLEPIVDSIKAFFQIGIGSKDLVYTLKRMGDEGVLNSYTARHCKFFMSGITVDDALTIIENFINSKSYEEDPDWLENIWNTYFLKRTENNLTPYLDDKELFTLYKSRFLDIFDHVEEIADEYEANAEMLYFALGLFGDYEGADYLYKYFHDCGWTLTEFRNFEIYRYAHPDVKQIFEEKVEEDPEYNEEALKRQEEFEKRFKPGTNYFINLVESGSIVSGTLNSLGFGDDTRSIAHSMFMDAKHYEEDEKSSAEIIDYVINNTPVYLLKDDNFYRGLGKQLFSGIDNSSGKSLGFFINSFSPNIKDNFKPAIFINNYHFTQQMKNDSFLKNLGLSEEILSRLTTVHEISHLLHYVQLEGSNGYFRYLDPLFPHNEKLNIEVYNKSRVYLTDLREITARAFGNISLMKYLLHDQLSVLSAKDEFRDACLDEMVDHMMDQEHLNLEGVTSENGKSIPFMTSELIKDWAGSRRGVFQFGSANQVATKKIERMRRYLKEYFRSDTEEIKRKATLDVLKKINSNKKLLESLSSRLKSENISTPEEREKLQKELSDIQSHVSTLDQELKDTRAGKYLSQYELAFEAIASFLALRSVEITNEIVSDPFYNPPMSIFDDALGNVYTEQTTPLTREELKDIRNYDLEISPDWSKRVDAHSPFAMDLLQSEKWRKNFPESYYPDPSKVVEITTIPVDDENEESLGIDDENEESLEIPEDKDPFVAFNLSKWKKNATK